jgi:hypothetical protein
MPVSKTASDLRTQSFFRPSGACSFTLWPHRPRLAPWAAFFRRFAAGFIMRSVQRSDIGKCRASFVLGVFGVLAVRGEEDVGL